MAELTLKSGPWGLDDVERFLATTVIPIRLASNGKTFPLVQSLWFTYADNSLWCCTRADSVLVRRLRKDPHCAFEVSADSLPYRGVRGRAIADITAEGAADMLPRLIDRYLGQTSSPLGDWLMSRIDNEVVIRLDHLLVTSWDYSPRMSEV